MAKTKKRKRKTYTSFEALVVHYLMSKILEEKDEKENTEKITHSYHINQTKNGGPFIQKEIHNQRVHWITWCSENLMDAEDIFDAKLRERGVNAEKFLFTATQDVVKIIELLKERPRRIRIAPRRKQEVLSLNTAQSTS